MLVCPYVMIGIDGALAKHVAHLFIRDPLVIYKELLNQDNTTSVDHFEVPKPTALTINWYTDHLLTHLHMQQHEQNIQSTNWQTVRFKPPPLPTDPAPAEAQTSAPTSPKQDRQPQQCRSSIGWRVEFRSMEVQLTDRENAAYAVFIVLLTRAILSFNLTTSSAIRISRSISSASSSSWTSTSISKSSLIGCLWLWRADILCFLEEVVETVVALFFKHIIVIIKDIILVITSRSRQSIIWSKIPINFFIFILIAIISCHSLSVWYCVAISFDAWGDALSPSVVAWSFLTIGVK